MIIKNARRKLSLNIWPDVFVCLILFTATLAVYVQIGNHELINFDDDVYVSDNIHVQSGLSLNGVSWAFTATREATWQPLVWLSYMLDSNLYGDNQRRSHLTNLFFHIVNTLLLYILLKRATGALWQSGFVATLFALHPMHVESVAWLAERNAAIILHLLSLTAP